MGRIAGSYGIFILSLLRNFQTVPKRLYHFTFPQEIYECFSFAMLMPKVVILCHFDDSNSSGGQVVSHWDYDGGRFFEEYFSLLMLGVID